MRRGFYYWAGAVGVLCGNTIICQNWGDDHLVLLGFVIGLLGFYLISTSSPRGI